MTITMFCHASESLRISGMGGAFVAVKTGETSVFGNPSALTNVQNNNAAISLFTQNLDYQNLPLVNEEQANTSISFRLRPSIYYTRAIGKFGLGLGYVYDLDNRGTTIRIESTTAEYIVDERKFLSDTNTILKYDLFKEKFPIFSVAYSINPELAIGIRLKYRDQVYKKGVITRPLQLSAVHGPDVNRNDATKLLPAIINNLDIGKSIDDFKQGKYGNEEVEADLSGSGIDVDLGMQADLYKKLNMTVGFMIDHLIQQWITLSQPSILRLGIGSVPFSWLATGLDLHKTINNKGFGVNVGWEASFSWQKGFSGGVILRNGFSYDLSKSNLSLGVGLRLGGSVWDYALVKPLDSSPISQATHLVSSSIEF
jgi:hypothetical protein